LPQKQVQTKVSRNLMHQTDQPQTQRAKSLNPLIYPSWWGDGDEDNSAPQRPTNVKTEQPPKRNRSVKNGGEVVVLDQNPAQRHISGDRRAPLHQEFYYPQHENTFSLADALQQARAQAERLDREIQMYEHQSVETDHSLSTNNIVDIRDDRYYQGQNFGVRGYSNPQVMHRSTSNTID
jgi:hypothetical protein